MPDEIILQVEDTPPAEVPATQAPPAAQSQATQTQQPQAQETFNAERLERLIERVPDAKSKLRDLLGVTQMENEMALIEACRDHNVSRETQQEYKEMLVGKTPDETRARVAKFAKLNATHTPPTAGSAAVAQPVAQAPAPVYQAPPPLQTAPAKPPDISKMSIDEQMKLLQETAAREW